MSRIRLRQDQRAAIQKPKKVVMMRAKARRSVVSGATDQITETAVNKTRASINQLPARVRSTSPGRVTASTSVSA